jgi:hypothetical protein
LRVHRFHPCGHFNYVLCAAWFKDSEGNILAIRQRISP